MLKRKKTSEKVSLQIEKGKLLGVNSAIYGTPLIKKYSSNFPAFLREDEGEGEGEREGDGDDEEDRDDEEGEEGEEGEEEMGVGNET